jgi:3-deoxy-manno-octulosonate cytidylyltransferase (CMP-KDO synthetase)
VNGNMNIFAFIPARYGSTRFPGKPLALIKGKAMIQHVYERSLQCAEIADAYVATDHSGIFEAVQAFGGNAVMTSGEHRSGTDRISEAAVILGIASEDLIVNIQGDQPIFDPAMISDLVAPFFQEDGPPMATLKCRVPREEERENPNHVKVVTDRAGYALYFSRYPIPFFRDKGEGFTALYKHLGFYAYRTDFLREFTRLEPGVLETAENLEQLRALEHGYRIKVCETPYNSLEVDVPEDIGRIEKALEAGSVRNLL